MYKSEFNNPSCEIFIGKLKKHIVTIDEDFTCDSKLTREELKTALLSLKKGKSPGLDGLSFEFYILFWDIIQEPLFCMYCECAGQGDYNYETRSYTANSETR